MRDDLNKLRCGGREVVQVVGEQANLKSNFRLNRIFRMPCRQRFHRIFGQDADSNTVPHHIDRGFRSLHLKEPRRGQRLANMVQNCFIGRFVDNQQVGRVVQVDLRNRGGFPGQQSGHAVAAQRNGVELSKRRAGHREIHVMLLHHAKNIVRASFPELDAHAREGSPICFQGFGQNGRNKGGQGGDPQAPLYKMIFPIGGLRDAVVQIFHLLGQQQNPPPRIGQEQPVSFIPKKQLDLQLRLQFRNGVAHGRLRDIQRFGGPCDASALRHPEKYLEAPIHHHLIISIL